MRIKNILIINDQDFMRVAMRYELNRIGGVQVVEAGNVAEALSVLKDQEIDIVLADINLGDAQRDGYDILREVRSAGKSVKFYMTSGMPKADEWPKARDLGADGYIQVPYETDELRQAIS